MNRSGLTTSRAASDMSDFSAVCGGSHLSRVMPHCRTGWEARPESASVAAGMTARPTGLREGIGSDRAHSTTVPIGPYSPFWALTVIALDIFVIWALAAHGRDVATDRY
jgi:hypothetical protein